MAKQPLDPPLSNLVTFQNKHIDLQSSHFPISFKLHCFAWVHKQYIKISCLCKVTSDFQLFSVLRVKLIQTQFYSY
jgi:hypothetical protein